MIAKWKKFSEDEIRKIVLESHSYREMYLKMGYAENAGSATRTMKEIIKKYNIDISHFLGQGWNKNNYDYSKLEKNCRVRNDSLSNMLMSIKERKCENCGIEEWLGEPINLEVHHINGNRTDNRIENLQLLCPNCHSYTPNFRKHNNKNRDIADEEFICALRESNSIRRALFKLDIAPYGGNYERAWSLIYKYNIEHLKKK